MKYLALLLLAIGCGSDDPIGRAQQAVEGGYPSTDSEVVEILYTGVPTRICTGTLIAPNVVLTARHCIAEVTSSAGDCSTVMFGADYPSSTLYVSTHASKNGIMSEYRAVGQVRTPSEGQSVCGFDIGLLLLTDTVPPAEATPRSVRIHDAPVNGETYSAIGFGRTCISCPSGSRYRLDGQQHQCTGLDCGAAWITERDWLGDSGVCPGDSGGPAIDTKGSVLGVTSKVVPPTSCAEAGYTRVDSWKEFIAQGVLDGAALGGYPPPDWLTTTAGQGGAAAATSGATSTSVGAGVGGGVTTTRDDDDDDRPRSSGCTLGDEGKPAPWLVALSLLLILRRDRRARRKAGVHSASWRTAFQRCRRDTAS